MVIVQDSVSTIEDEEWTTENEDVMQQQEEYDEDEDSFREEEEVRDRNVENLELNQKFEVRELEQRDSPHVMDNVVLGFDEGVEVEIPSDDVEKSIRHQEKSFGMNDGSVSMVEERVIIERFPSDEQNLLTAEDCHGTSADSSSLKVLDTSALPGSVGATCTAASADIIDGADSSGSTCLAPHPTVISSTVDVTAVTSQPIVSSVSSTGSQGDLPIKLQFGLFSGPSLIPSPVPAIQIGSIQMPLHINPSIGPSITHMHPSQPPMFQFGQLRYTSPISQGILPMSFVPPNMLGHLNLNQDVLNSGNHKDAQDASTQNISKDETPSVLVTDQPRFVSASSVQSNGGLLLSVNTVSNAGNHDENSAVHTSTSGASGPCDGKFMSNSSPHAEEKGQLRAASRNYPPPSKARGSDRQSHHAHPMSQ
ncbi:uncharacterized protein LOC121804094 [Salvia splendens]|uniref:uncharacterized protein LOC121804094 n=1 Tax=Salvia splendens TaxID=180675 RepID=UPI001C257E43|nr:uncharacterized protein LOC121804094 [Salvia splendens]